MATKDPHIAYIDAHEQLERIHAMVARVTETIKRKIAAGHKLTELEKHDLMLFRAKIIDRTKQLQEIYIKEIESHGKLED